MCMTSTHFHYIICETFKKGRHQHNTTNVTINNQTTQIV